jgi:hypothetical protein
MFYPNWSVLLIPFMYSSMGRRRVSFLACRGSISNRYYGVLGEIDKRVIKDVEYIRVVVLGVQIDSQL